MAQLVSRITASVDAEWTLIFVFFFFSSRRRHTRCGRDWSSDVCSSDLRVVIEGGLDAEAHYVFDFSALKDLMKRLTDEIDHRSEERRVGKEGRSRGSPYH